MSAMTIENKIKLLVGDLLFQNTVLVSELEKANETIEKLRTENEPKEC